METTASFGYWIRRQRKALDLTQQMLADQVGYSLATIKKIESDERRPSRQIAERLAVALGVPKSQRKMFLEVARGLRRVNQLSLAHEAAVATPRIDKIRESFPNNLPIQLTSFIGREKELDEITNLIAKNRLVTLIGAGGIGKTRLAHQIATDLPHTFKDGVWWVELAPLTDETLVPQAVAKTLGVREVPNQAISEAFFYFLRSKQLLLVFDNCEHLITACAQLVEELLKGCPNLKILATSREALGLTGESVWHISTLSVPEPQDESRVEVLIQYEAIQLFVERAVAVRSDFALTEKNARFVAQVCLQLDGIPLALELAAARVKVLTVEQIAARLDNRFNLLTSGSRTALPRQQTLRTSMDWSYEHLTDLEQILLRRLSVFTGGWALGAAEAVCSGKGMEAGEILDLLMHLINKSLVITLEKGREARYQMLETIRQYACDKLLESGELEQTRDRHLDFFLTFAEEAEPKLHGSEQLAWFNVLETEHDNFRTALEWTKTGKFIQKGLRLANALRLFWFVRGYWNEAREWLMELLKQPGAVEKTIPCAYALTSAGFFATYQGDFAVGRVLLIESITLCRELGMESNYILALALFNLGWNLIWHDVASARVALEESLTIARQTGYKYVIAISLNALGGILKQQGSYSAAQGLFEESVATSQDEGDRRFSAAPLASLGFVLYKQGDPIAARSKLDQALMIARDMGDEHHVVWALIYLGDIEMSEGRYKQAESNYAESLVIGRRIGGKDGIAECLEALATLLATKNNQLAENQDAAKLFGAAEAFREAFNIFRESSLRSAYDRIIAIVSARLGTTTFESAWAQGRAMTLEKAIEYALGTENEYDDLQHPKPGAGSISD